MMLEMKSINIWINTWTELQCLTFSVLQGACKKMLCSLNSSSSNKKTQHPEKQNNNKSKAQTSFS